MKYSIEGVFDEYCKVASKGDFSHNPLFCDKNAQDASISLVKKNLQNYLTKNKTVSLFNLILADKRIPVRERHMMLAKLDTIDIESSKAKHFTPIDLPKRIYFDELSVGTVFLWCDMLHVYVGSYLAAEVKSDLSEALSVYSFDESCDDKETSTEIIKIGDCDPKKIKNIKCE